MAKNFKKLVPIFFVLFFVVIISCKKNSEQIEPVIENVGEIVSSNKLRGTLDTGFVSLSYSDGKVNGLVIYLQSQEGASQFSNINIVYTNIPDDTREIPEGDFILHGEDFFHYSINNGEDFAGHQKELKFSLKRISNNRYSISFSGKSSIGTSITGFYINDLGVNPW